MTHPIKNTKPPHMRRPNGKLTQRNRRNRWKTQRQTQNAKRNHRKRDEAESNAKHKERNNNKRNRRDHDRNKAKTKTRNAAPNPLTEAPDTKGPPHAPANIHLTHRVNIWT